MPLGFIDHYLIQTADLAGTRDWYVDVLGMREGPHPDFRFPVCWLYIGDKDVLHLAEGGANVPESRLRYLGQESTATSGSGVIDHIAFHCTDLVGMKARLDTHKVDYAERQVDDQGLYQLFFKDPNGVKVELNFDAAEAAGIRAEVMATDLPATAE
jgi:catechol 2,3-dioxygenase-like lactoylglutathione lyase family enzyme